MISHGLLIRSDPQTIGWNSDMLSHTPTSKNYQKPSLFELVRAAADG
jgi:hypothetical protein